MKNNKFKLFILFNLPVITICFLLASCDNFFMPESKIGKVSQNYNISPINRKSELALWHLAENHESPVETLQEQVQAWLQSDTGTESRNKSSVTSVYSYSVTVENGFSSLPANRRSPDAAPERSVIPFYVFKLENHSEGTSGFAFTCGDLRIGGLLALVENGDFHDTENPFWEIFLGCLDEYIEESIAVYNSINDSDIEEALTVNNADASRSADEDPPDYKFDEVKFEKTYEQVYLKTVTRWRQREPYNWVLNKFAGKSVNHWAAGCAAVAMGHIMAYHEWPLKPPSSIRQSEEWFWSYHQFSGLYKSTFYDPFSNTTKSFSSITYDWKGMKSEPLWLPLPVSGYSEDDKKNLMQIGVLFLAIGDKTDMKYNNDNLKGSGALQEGVIDGFEALGYNRPEKKDYSFARVKNSLRECKPVMMGGSRGEIFELSGHYWIIDGYRTADVTIPSEPGVIKTNENFVHCIPGWGDGGVGWYFSGVFDLNAPVADSNARSAGKEGYYKHKLHIFTNLYPNNNNKVTISEIEGVRPPVTGYMPRPTENTVINITETAQFTGIVRWFIPTGNGVLKEIAVGDKFADGIEYTAEITLAPKKGFNFRGVDANYFTVDEAVSASNIANSGIITAVFPPTVTLFTIGDGTESSPFIINTVVDLNNLRHYSKAHFKLGNNINLPNTPWIPIPEFNGHLDGNGYTITNLNMTFTDGLPINDYFNDCVVFGLFVKNKGTINNLKVTSNINLTNIPGNYNLPQGREIIAGTIAAINYGIIQNSNVSASSGNPMINSTIHVYNIVGGIVGYNYGSGKITSCANNGAIYTSGNTGGIIGINFGATGNCTNNALIRYTYVNENRGIGGIVGVNSGDITSGTNNGTISYANSSNNSNLIQPLMAHIAGNNFYGTISDTFYSCGGTVNTGALQTVNYTSGGITQTHNQALYAGNRVLGSGYIGNGTESDPFIIITPENLIDMQHRNAYYKLAKNIDLQNVPWTPIPQFDGNFNGNGYSILNLNMTFTNSLLVDNRSISYGLIAVNNGTINGMRVTANINLTNISGNYSLPQNREITVGVIAAENNGIIQNSFVSSSNSNPMINSSIHVRNKTGGITGNNNTAGRINSCTNNGTIHSNGGTGGIIGNNQGTTISCINNALIRYTYVNDNRGIGGIVGENNSGSVTSGTNNGTIFYANTNTSTNNLVQPYMAHIIGYSINGTISGSFSFNNGTVNPGTLRLVTYTSGGITQTHNQAFYVDSRVIGRDHISGSGTANSPYIITSGSHLIYLRQFPNANFRLANNIDMALLGTWTPIQEFTGVLEGNNKTISNLNMTFTNGLQINDDYNDCVTFGLFAINRGTIRNLNVTANINLTNIPGNYSLPQGRGIVTGVIAAVNKGTIQNSAVSASGSNPMINSTIHVYNVVGGITGYAYASGNITSCTNNGAIYTSGNTGGIIGVNFGSPGNCTNNALIRYTYVNENRGIGGIVGVNSGDITSGTNNGTISYANSSNNSNLIQPLMAHIAGRNFYGKVSGSFNYSGGTVNPGALQTVTYTSNGVTQTHNQALYVGNRVVGY